MAIVTNFKCKKLHFLCFTDMPWHSKDHKACRALVCGLCFNDHGQKAARLMGRKEEAAIKELRPGYNSLDSCFGAGICQQCIFLLREREQGKPVALTMPEQYSVVLARDLRSREDQPCTCKICSLAKLSGPAFKTWQREVKGKVREKVSRMCSSCYTMVMEGRSHKCSVSTAEAVSNLSLTLPEGDVQQLLGGRISMSKLNSFKYLISAGSSTFLKLRTFLVFNLGRSIIQWKETKVPS